MKIALLVFVCGVVTLGSVQSKLVLQRHGLPPPDPPSSRAATPQWGNIVQKLDHFDESNTKAWNMRFLHNGQFFKAGGPIFLMLGAEWTIDGGWLQSGQMYDMAQTHGAYMFYTEHRYYGKSYPTSDLSPANLGYLTTELALADVAKFIVDMKAQIPALAGSKVVVFGGSYGGNMAIWMREVYPNLVHAAVSSSAPVFAKVDFQEYHEVVQTSFGKDCSSVISNGIDAILTRLQTSAGQTQVSNDFHLCQKLDVNNFDEFHYFFSTIANIFGGIVQYATQAKLQQTCDSIMYPTNVDDYTRLSRFITRSQGNNCLSGYANLKAYMSDWSLNRGESRQWIYQTCTRYGFFQTSNTATNLYRNTIPVQMYHRWCADFFGPEFTPQLVRNGVDKTNMFYGGLNPRVSRVVSVHGTVDPWHSLGLSKSLGDSLPVFVVPGTSHCADLSSLSVSDSQEMRNAKIQVQNYIAQWLREN